MKKPKISVVMAVYNAEKYLDESIQSVLNQTLKDFELIIIDDASLDGSREIILDYVKNDSRIQYLKLDKNSGQTIARNAGLKKARGTYIAILDADDVSLPTRLDKQYNFLENHKDVFLCGSNYQKIDEGGKSLFTKPLETKWKLIKKNLDSGENQFVHSTIMFRNKGILYREKIKFSEDYDFYLVLLTSGYKLINLEEILVYLRLNISSIRMSKSKTYKEFFFKKIRFFYKERLKSGKDSYNSFEPEKILGKFSLNKREILEGKIILLLKSGKVNESRRYFKNYSLLKNVAFLNKITFFLITYFPFIFKVYQKIKK